MSRRVVFLDRDGTINVDRGYVYRREDWKFTDQAVEAIRLLNDMGYYIAVVTNQSGIATGRYAMTDVLELHDFVARELWRLGARIDYFAICPHSEADRCMCRKPQTGLAAQIEDRVDSSIDYALSWTIGDKITDAEFGWNLGTNTALLQSVYWRLDELPRSPSLVCSSLYAAVREGVLADISGRPPRG